MATYKLIPSSLTGGSMQNASNAYTDTDSTTYAEVDFASGLQDYYLGGFVSLPPVENVTSVVVKLKACLFSSGSSYSLQATLLSAPDGIALSDTITISSTTATVYTFTLTASAETVASYADTLCLHLYNVGGIHKVYGADITIEADLKIFNNKIIYGNETLIDLTSDTATASDVAAGKTFHLANGMIATGALQGVEVESGTWSPTSDVYKATLNFSKIHTVPPAAFLVYDVGTTETTNSSNVLICCVDFNGLFDNNYDGGYYTSDGGVRAFKVNVYRSSGSTNSSVSRFTTGRDGSGTSGYRYYATESSIYAMGSTNSYYWRSARTYKWIAIWI